MPVSRNVSPREEKVVEMLSDTQHRGLVHCIALMSYTSPIPERIGDEPLTEINEGPSPGTM
jgi:hypothetical protein